MSAKLSQLRARATALAEPGLSGGEGGLAVGTEPAPETLSRAQKIAYVSETLDMASDYARKAQTARIRLEGLQRRVAALSASVVAAEGR